MLPVDGGEGGAVALLPAEQLHDRHPREVLLEEGVDAGDPAAGLAEGLARSPAKPVGDEEEEGDDGEGHEGETPVEGEHHPHDPEEREEVPEDGDDAGGEQVVDGVHVGRDPGHEPSHRVAVEEADVQPLEVAEDLPAQVLHDALARHLHDVGLAEADHPGGGESEEVERGHPGEPRRVALRDVAVDGDLGQPGAHEVEPGHRHDEDEGGEDGAPVGTQVGEQPLEESPVVGPGEDGIVVLGGDDAHAASSEPFICSSRSCRRWRSA